MNTNLLRATFRGTGVAIVTPFKENGNIDWDSFRHIIDFQIGAGVEYLVILGTTGESATIHGAEKQELFLFAKDAVAGRVPLIAGIGGNDTRQVLLDLKNFNLDGYTAVLSVGPYYNKPSQEGLFQHYKAIAEASPLPVMMYNVPGRTGQNITAATTLRIARECPNIFATKEACGNLDQINTILRERPEGFMVISGDDALTLPMIAAGAEGVVSVVANAYPKEFSDMVRLCLDGNFQAASAIHLKLTPVIDTLFAEGSPSGVKAYLAEMGHCQETFRLPVVAVSEGMKAKIKTLMGEFAN